MMRARCPNCQLPIPFTKLKNRFKCGFCGEKLVAKAERRWFLTIILCMLVELPALFWLYSNMEESEGFFLFTLALPVGVAVGVSIAWFVVGSATVSRYQKDS